MHKLFQNKLALIVILLFAFSINTEVTYSSEETILDTMLKDFPGFVEIKEYHPEEYKALVEELEKYIKQNQDDSIRSIVQAKIMELFSKDILKASPESIELYLVSTTNLFEVVGKREPKCCDDLLENKTKCLEETLTFKEIQSYLGMMGTVIRQANTNPSTTEIDKKTASTDIEIITTSDNFPVGDSCDLLNYVLGGILELPPDRTSNAFKFLLTSQ